MIESPRAVAGEKSRTLPLRAGARVKLVALYAAAALLGYWFGAYGLHAFGTREPGTPLARVGFALREEQPSGNATDWAALRADVALVRAQSRPPLRDVFDLVVALRGLENAGSADFSKAEQLCRALAWPRCDKPALELLRQRSRP
jgi:hypothetical protein